MDTSPAAILHRLFVHFIFNRLGPGVAISRIAAPSEEDANSGMEYYFRRWREAIADVEDCYHRAAQLFQLSDQGEAYAAGQEAINNCKHIIDDVQYVHDMFRNNENFTVAMAVILYAWGECSGIALPDTTLLEPARAALNNTANSAPYNPSTLNLLGVSLEVNRLSPEIFRWGQNGGRI